MRHLVTRHRIARLTGVASVQLVVQVVAFGAGIVLVRAMEPSQYGYYTLAISMAAMAVTLSDLGLGTAVMAAAGRLGTDPHALGGLVADAQAVRRRLSWWPFVVLLPLFVALLLRQSAAPWQAVVLAVLAAATAVLQVRAGVAQAVARVLGHVAVQQRLDLIANLGKLGLVLTAAALALDATIACVVNLAMAAVLLWGISRHLDRHMTLPTHATGEHQGGLLDHVRRQAPNSVYFVVSSQLALWLIGVFGSAERVAEVGALSRLGAVFTVMSAVSAALVLPYFARRQRTDELWSGFIGVNLVYGGLLAALISAAVLLPGPILYVLGGHYDGLHAELPWMVAASTLSAWAGAIYGIGCARGWVMPVSIGLVTSLLATIGAAAMVDVSTVRGVFLINTATGLVATVVTVWYFALQLRQHAAVIATQAP